MKVFTLYIGTNRAGARKTIVHIIDERFPSFTVISGEGHFQGKTESMWFVRIATEEPLKVIETAEAIRVALNQEGVGIEYESRYYRCMEGDCAKELRNFLKKRSRIQRERRKTLKARNRTAST